MKIPRSSLMVAAALVAAFLAPASGHLAEAQDEAATSRPASRPTTGPAAVGKPDTQKDGPFGGMLAFTTDKQFFADWDKPETPHLSPAKTVRRGVPVYTVLLFGGAEAGPGGNGDVTFDYRLVTPDGKEYGAEKAVVALQGPPQPPKFLMLSGESPVVSIDPDDPAGTYTMTVTIRDHVAKRQVTLRQAFVVEEGAATRPAE